MKTRCRNNRPRRRTESINRKDSSSVVPEEDFTDAQQSILRDTRSYKQAVKVSCENDHADAATKDSTCDRVIENETSNLFCPGVSTRSSTRPNKRQRCPSPSVQNTGSQDAKAVVSSGPAGGTMKGQRKKKKKVKRQWESWGPEDRDTFFEALHVYGKDFDKVQSFIATRQKRRGEVPALIKNKDQVRHFYYRTLNKISKYIPAEKLAESDTQKKMMYELLSLVCYGELRKKMHGLNEKQGKKLSELINDGATSIRYNQRNIRIKAPVCRALKKLLDDGEAQPPPVPSKLVVEIMPQDNIAWTTVQRLSKNPRLRTTVSSRKQLGGLLTYLKCKWPVASTVEGTLDVCFVVPSEFYNGSSITSSDALPGKSAGSQCSPSPCNSSPRATEKVDDIYPASGKALGDVPTSAVSADATDNSESMDCGKENRPSSLVHSNLDVKTVKPSTKESQEASKDVLDDVQECRADEEISTSEKGVSDASEGDLKFWTLQSCGNITIGDIYCRVGRPAKVKLEYCWKTLNGSDRKWNHNALQKLLKVAATEFTGLKENKRSESSKSSVSKQSTVTKTPSSTAQSKTTRIAPKKVDRLPFLLPSVVPPSVTAQGSTKLSVSSLSPPTRLLPRARKQQRKPAPIVVHQRTLLPRPAGAVPRVAANTVPPGAVAVSFIPQPGQAVGTILAAGLPTTSVTTSASQFSTSKHSTTVSAGMLPSSQTLSTPVASPADIQSPNPSPTNSLESISSSPLPPKVTNSLTILSDSVSSVSQQIPTSTSAITNTTAVSPSPLLTGQSYQGNNILTSFDLENFVATSVRNGASDVGSNDSIIGLALGSVLDNGSIPSATISEDSASEFLTNFLSVGSKDSTCGVSEGLYDVESTASLESTVHIEELNSGIAGGAPVTLANAGLDDRNISTFNQVSMQSSAQTFVTSSITSTTTTTSSPMGPSDIMCVPSNGKKASDSFLIPTSLNSSLSPQVSPLRIQSPDPDPQWLNGEAADISMSSILDKIVTSPDKQCRTDSFELPSLPVELRDSTSQDSLLSSRLMDMDTALQSMMDENSVDYIKKFQDLTNRMSGPAQYDSPNSSPKTFDSNKDPAPNASDPTLSFSNFFSKQHSLER